ncbi:MAG: single-stranded DNA-binding protein [Gammaproteobacteria bacterium]|nr:MAG: single-stranded DNA-binding protein [Gammaproteobacteria bacterium]
MKEECYVAYKSPITVTGNISQDPQLNEVAGGTPKLTFSVASNHRYMKDGEWVDNPSFFNVVVWRQTAEQAAKFLEKGLGVIVTGRLEQRSWRDNDDNPRSTVEIVADDIAINVWALDDITRRSKSGSQSSAAAKPVSSAPAEDPW